jgi:molybdopterin molybdotransferase
MSTCDCATPAHSAGLLSMEAALERLLARARPLTDTETVPLDAALGRVLAEPLLSHIDVPGWDNSAMDGYALRHADLDPAGPTRLPVSQRIPAGRAGAPLAPGSAARIFPGAPVPPGADTVVIQEVCDAADGSVLIREAPRPGANVRRAGEDIRQGAPVLLAGTRLRPQHLGLAASVGTARLTVFRRLRVALLASGDELVAPGEPLGPGQIYNSNATTLAGLVRALGGEVRSLDRVPDTLEATRAALTAAAADADLVLASGGVSVGDEDHVRPALEQLGSLDLWKVAIRPGKPLAFGHIGTTPFLGSPGNPVSLFVTFCLFARPFMLRCQGVGEVRVTPLRLPAAFTWPKPDRRQEYARARLIPGEDGQLRVQVYPSRSSAVLSSVAWAGGLAVIPPDQTLQPGDLVDFLPFSELLG